MSQIISLTVTSRNGKPLTTPTVYGFNVDDIVEPITRVFGGGGVPESRVVTRGIIRMDKDSKNVDKVIWTVQENLTAIDAMSIQLLKLSPVRRRLKTLVNDKRVFNTRRIQEALTAGVKGTTIFMYNEDADVLPVEYEVSESIATIVASS